MAYVTPKIYEGVLPPMVAVGVQNKYLKFTQSGWKSNTTDYDYGHNQHPIIRNSRILEIDGQDIPEFEVRFPEIADAFIVYNK